MNRSTKSRRFLGILLGIAVIALILRLIVGFELSAAYPPVTAPSPQTDVYTYLKTASEVVDGTYDYSKGFYYQPFIYAVYIPAIFMVFGKSVTGIIVIQSLLGGLTVFLVGWLFAIVFGRRCGLIAAGLLAIARFHVFYTPFALIACLQSFLITAIALLAILAARKRSPWLWAACGVACGVANLTRGNVVLLMPIVVAFALWSLRPKPKPMVIGTGLLLVCFLLPQLPFAIVNSRVKGTLSGPSTAGGAVLALGNTPEAPPGGREPIYEAGGMAYPPSFADWTKSHNARGDERVSVAANVMKWIGREPFAWVELKARMFLLFWNKMEIPNNVSIIHREQPVKSAILHQPVLLDFWLIGGLGFAGMLIALFRIKRQPSAAFLGATVLIYSLSIVLFYVLARFRLPIIPILCGCAAVAVDALYRGFKHKTLKDRKVQVLTGLAILSVVFVAYGYDAYRYGWEPVAHRAVRPQGVQVPLKDRYLIRDNGPLQFGSWAQQATTAVTFQKTMLVPASITDAYDRCLVRLFLGSPQPQPLSAEINGVQATLAVPRGADWVQMELPMSALVKDGNAMRFTGRIASNGSQPFMYFGDRQRDYGRTVIDGQRVPAELVFELCFLRKTDVE